MRDILKIPDFAFFKNCALAGHNSFFFFDVLIILVSSKIALPPETSSKFRQFILIKIDQNCARMRNIRKILIIYESLMMLRVSIPILYQTNVFEVAFRAQEGGTWRSFLDRIGIGFVGIVIQNLIVYGMDPIPILYQNAPLKSRSSCFEGNIAPVRSILKI